MRSDHSSKCFRDGHYHMMSRERKIFVISWHASFVFYKEKSNNNYSLGSVLLIHLSNVTLKKIDISISALSSRVFQQFICSV